MSNILPYEKTKEYLKAVLDLEQNQYIQEQTLKQLSARINVLGISKEFVKPQIKQHCSTKLGDFLKIGAILSIPIAFMLLLFSIIMVGNAYIGIIVAIIGGIVIGNILALVSYMIAKLRCNSINKWIDADNNAKYKNYLEWVDYDKRRVTYENAQKSVLIETSNKLRQKYWDTQNSLNKLYSYDILHKNYCNIIAISSIYQYFESGRTKSLGVGEYGDMGAYNIYENEMRLNKIITNTEIIITKLDQLIENQKELYDLISEGNQKIAKLTNETIKLSQLAAEGNQQRETLIANSEANLYIQSQTRNELKFMNDWNMYFNSKR